MRRFDKKKNIAQANILAEQHYLKSKGLIKEEEQIDELSTGLAQRAGKMRDVSTTRSQAETDPLAHTKQQGQQKQFSNYLNPDIAAKLATVNGKCFGVANDGIHVGFHAEYVPERPADARCHITIRKDGYQVTGGELSALPEATQRRLPAIIKIVQADFNKGNEQPVNELSPALRFRATDAATAQGRTAQGERMYDTTRHLNRRDTNNTEKAAQDIIDQKVAQFYGKTMNVYGYGGTQYLQAPDLETVEKVEYAEDQGKVVIRFQSGYFIAFYNEDNTISQNDFMDRQGAMLVMKIIKAVLPEVNLNFQDGSMGKIVGIHLKPPAAPQA